MKKIIDLTFNIEPDMTTFSAYWHPKVEVEKLGSHDKEGRETRKLVLGTHSGTHVDAPLHFVKAGSGIDQLPLDALCGDVTVVDCTGLDVVTPKLLGKIELKPRLIFKFGWSRYWKTGRYYKGYPYFSREAAEYLIQKRAKLIAMDTPSPDNSTIKLSGSTLGSPEDSPIHKLFLQNSVILVEYLTNLEQVTEAKGWKIVVAPIKVAGADGAPARVFIYAD